MTTVIRRTHARRYASAIAAATLIAVGAGSLAAVNIGARGDAGAGTPGLPYGAMPELAPIGVRVDRYFDVPESAKGPAVDPAKGYRMEKLGDGLYMVTDGAYQSMFM